jgi:phosphatidylinositol glycan class F
MALLSATGLVYVHGVDASVWKEVWGISRPADAVWGSALGTGLGAWFGAIPIPLDWYALLIDILNIREVIG